MTRIKSKEPKVNAFYRLPKKLVQRIRLLAATRDVDPCVIAEQLIRHGLKRTEQPESSMPAHGA